MSAPETRAAPRSRPLGVGFIGAGPVTQSIHLPVLARHPDRFRVERIVDIDAGVAQAVAESAGARAAGSVDELLGDAAVDLVAICTPHRLHAEQAIAACEAGVRGVLVEKPFATGIADARRIADASRAHGVPVIVGAMHAFDPAVAAARRLSGGGPGALAGRTRSVRSRIILPTNERFEDWASEVRRAPTPLAAGAGGAAPSDADALRARLLGLGIHDLPLVREAAPDWRDVEVVSAWVVTPLGYLVTARAGSVNILLEGSFRDHWRPEWELEVVRDDGGLEVTFPPSYVHAGSATATVRHGSDVSRVEPFADNGYDAEWHHLAQLADAPSFDHLDALVDDLEFALTIADRAADHLQRAGRA